MSQLSGNKKDNFKCHENKISFILQSLNEDKHCTCLLMGDGNAQTSGTCTIESVVRGSIKKNKGKNAMR